MTSHVRSARIRWTGSGMVFQGEGGSGAGATLDGDSKAGASPMEALLMSIGGCMAVDIQMILEKGRVPLESLEVALEGERAPEPPRRYTRIVMDVHTRGPGPEHREKVERAVALSRDKYCSVFHTLRPDLETEFRIHLE